MKSWETKHLLVNDALQQNADLVVFSIQYVCVCVCALLCVFVSVCNKTFWVYRAAVSVFTFVAISVWDFIVLLVHM